MNNNCSTQPFAYNVQYYYNGNCLSCNNGCADKTADASCVIYTGANLPCSGVQTNDNLEVAIQKLDEKVCSVVGDYSTYNMNCLPEFWGSTISTESMFVEAITKYTCDTFAEIKNFTDVTFVNYITETDVRISNLEVPGIVCSYADVTSIDSLQDILNKYCTKFGDIDTNFDISGVDWSQCFVVSDNPVTLTEAFNLVVQQICQVNSNAGGNSVTFDNSTNCLNGTSNDSLSETIGLITNRACSSPTFDANNLAFGCVPIPSFSSTTDITSAINQLLSSVSALIQNTPTFDSGDFTVTSVGGPCDGINVALATPINQDRFVAATATDNTPGTLQDKLVAGTGITLDFSTPTQVTINSAGTADSFEVKASATDSSPDFLDQKLAGGSNSGISITPSYNGGTEQVDLNVSVNLVTLFDVLLDQLVTDSDLYAKFCEKVANCPSPCDAPTNVQAVAGSTPVITTTTTTTLP